MKEWTTGLRAEWWYQTIKDLPISNKASVLRLESQLLCAILPPSATKPPEAHDPIIQIGVGFLFVGFGVFVVYLECLVLVGFFLGNTFLLYLYQKALCSIACFLQQLRLYHPLNKFFKKWSFIVKKWKLFLKTFSKGSLPYADSDNTPTFLSCTNKKYLHIEE